MAKPIQKKQKFKDAVKTLTKPRAVKATHSLDKSFLQLKFDMLDLILGYNRQGSLKAKHQLWHLRLKCKLSEKVD